MSDSEQEQQYTVQDQIDDLQEAIKLITDGKPTSKDKALNLLRELEEQLNGVDCVVCGKGLTELDLAEERVILCHDNCGN